jgi:hypothetical protein
MDPAEQHLDGDELLIAAVPDFRLKPEGTSEDVSA